jgi:hypothetical protein
LTRDRSREYIRHGRKPSPSAVERLNGPIRIRQQAATPEDAKALKVLSCDRLAVEALMQRDHGLTVERNRAARERAGTGCQSISPAR